MCGQNIVEQKAEYNVCSKHRRTQSFGQKHSRTKSRVKMCGRNIAEQNVKCNVSSKLKQTKSRVQCVVET